MQQVAEVTNADGGPSFLALGTQPSESKQDGSATKTLGAPPAASSVLTFWLAVTNGNACTKDLCVDGLCKYTNTCGG